MASRDVDQIKQELAAIGGEFARFDELLKRRAALVDEARDAAITWREAADLLGITEPGLRKHQAAYRRRQQSTDEAKAS